MADWRINEKYRKPRRAKGTPFFVHRNYYAFGVICIGAVSWYLYELWPAAKKLKNSQLNEGKFNLSEGLDLKRKHIQAGFSSGPVDELLAKARDREVKKYEENDPKPQSWFSKAFSSQPDL